MRLFVAVRPPKPALEHLAAHLGRRPSPTWHITLAFLGEVRDPAPIPTALLDLPGPFELALAGGGTFDGRVLWVGVGTGQQPLQRLAGAVEDRMRSVGVALPQRAYVPHLTVQRGRDLTATALEAYAGAPWPVRAVELVRSDAGQHTTLTDHPLRAA